MNSGFGETKLAVLILRCLYGDIQLYYLAIFLFHFFLAEPGNNFYFNSNLLLD